MRPARLGAHSIRGGGDVIGRYSETRCDKFGLINDLVLGAGLNKGNPKNPINADVAKPLESALRSIAEDLKAVQVKREGAFYYIVE